MFISINSYYIKKSMQKFNIYKSTISFQCSLQFPQSTHDQRTSHCWRYEKLNKCFLPPWWQVWNLCWKCTDSIRKIKTKKTSWAVSNVKTWGLLQPDFGCQCHGHLQAKPTMQTHQFLLRLLSHVQHLSDSIHLLQELLNFYDRLQVSHHPDAC